MSLFGAIKVACKNFKMKILLLTRYRGAVVGRNFYVGGAVTIHAPGFVAGDYVYIGHDSEIAPHVSIGDYTSVSSCVVITGGDHVFDQVGVPIRFAGRPSSSKTTIGADVLIGHGVTIIRGVTIGNGAVVGAGSVVTKDVAPYSVVGGIPARLLKLRFNPEQASAHEENMKSFMPVSEQSVRPN